MEIPNAELEQATDEIARLRKGIKDYLDGDWHPSPRDARRKGPHETCLHGQFYWKTCESCIDEYFEKLLTQTTG